MLHLKRVTEGSPCSAAPSESITGVIVVRDSLRIPDSRRTASLGRRSLANPPLVVPESKRSDLLTDMQTSGTHIAVVVDEYGGTAGMVTIEDIAEEMLRVDHRRPDLTATW